MIIRDKVFMYSSTNIRIIKLGVGWGRVGGWPGHVAYVDEMYICIRYGRCLWQHEGNRPLLGPRLRF